MKITLKGCKAVGGVVEGEAVVSKRSFSFVGGINDKTGVIIEKRHELYGKSIAGKIFVFPSGMGSSGGSHRLYLLSFNGVAPKAIINTKADPIVVQGALIANIPMIYHFNEDPVEVIKTGDHVRVDADRGIVEVTGT